MVDSGPVVDVAARPSWCSTGDSHFPFAAWHAGRWWVLRLNHGFPEHDMYTVFIDGRAVADVTGDSNSDVALIASVGALSTVDRDRPLLDDDVVRRVVGAVAGYAAYGSERGDPCMFCAP